MTSQQPAPEAVEAVAKVIRSHRAECYMLELEQFGWHCLTCGEEQGVFSGIEIAEQHALAHNAGPVLTFIRDAIHRDGDDADAIREALGLRVRWNVRPQHYTPFVGGTGWKPVTVRRVVGEWQEVQP